MSVLDYYFNLLDRTYPFSVRYTVRPLLVVLFSGLTDETGIRCPCPPGFLSLDLAGNSLSELGIRVSFQLRLFFEYFSTGSRTDSRTIC